MNLYLLRHSNAADQPPKGETGDSARRLTPEGIYKARVIGRAMRRMGLTFDLVLSSPAARAQETAALVVAELKPRPTVELHGDLQIGGQLRSVGKRILKGPRPPEDVLLVGHEPDLSRIAALLLAGAHPVTLTFKKGGLCKLAVGRLRYGRCATLEWQLTPRLLAHIAGEG